uniref:DUF148 domain-containing protein n=1 Tax=Elaeophora elaphi TaxID=1147741 RepID=A0A0R3RM33_9BILA
MEVKMNGNCAKGLLLLVLFAMTYSSLGSKCERWLELPPYMPEVPEAQEEYCDLFQKLELSRTQLNDAIKEWAKKYNVSEDCNEDLAEKARNEDTFYEILQNKTRYNDTANKVVKEIVDLVGNKNTSMRIIYFKIYQILYALPKEEMAEDIRLWSEIYKGAEDEWSSQFKAENLGSDMDDEMAGKKEDTDQQEEMLVVESIAEMKLL